MLNNKSIPKLSLEDICWEIETSMYRINRFELKAFEPTDRMDLISQITGRQIIIIDAIWRLDLRNESPDSITRLHNAVNVSKDGDWNVKDEFFTFLIAFDLFLKAKAKYDMLKLMTDKNPDEEAYSNLLTEGYELLQALEFNSGDRFYLTSLADEMNAIKSAFT